MNEFLQSLTPLAALAIGAAPWVIIAFVTFLRARGSRSLETRSPLVEPSTAPLLSVVVPARNEELNIERCLESLSSSTYPRLQIVVVDDHSTDATGEIARRMASNDARIVATTPAPLPHDWFGKSWACRHGAEVADGEVLLFTDADTWHHPELHSRLYNAMIAMRAGLVSVAGTQEVDTFWEKLLQPIVFMMLLLRYGGSESVNRSTSERGKIANGQCIMSSRAAYNAVGGHEAVKGSVAEDLKLAQVYFAAGQRPMLELGLPYLRTRMYRSLHDVIGGWGKNIYAGSVETMPFGRFGRRVLTPVFLLASPVTALLLLVSWIVAAAAGSEWSTILLGANVAQFLFFAAVYAAFGVGLQYTVLYPLGVAVILYIIAGAIWRGEQVQWKGRNYTTNMG